MKIAVICTIRLNHVCHGVKRKEKLDIALGVLVNAATGGCGTHVSTSKGCKIVQYIDHSKYQICSSQSLSNKSTYLKAVSGILTDRKLYLCFLRHVKN